MKSSDRLMFVARCLFVKLLHHRSSGASPWKANLLMGWDVMGYYGLLWIRRDGGCFSPNCEYCERTDALKVTLEKRPIVDKKSFSKYLLYFRDQFTLHYGRYGTIPYGTIQVL